MPLLRRTATVVASATVLSALTAGPAFAHEAWFVEHPASYPLDWSALRSPLTVAGVLAAVVVAVLWRAVAARAPRPELGVLRPLARLVPWVPRVLGVHLFGGTELVGHLPVYGVLLVLVVLGSDRATTDAVSWVPGRPVRSPVAAVSA